MEEWSVLSYKIYGKFPESPGLPKSNTHAGPVFLCAILAPTMILWYYMLKYYRIDKQYS